MTNLKTKYKYKILDSLNLLRDREFTTYHKMVAAIPVFCGVSRMTFYRWTRIPLEFQNGEKEKDIPAKSLEIIAKSFCEAGLPLTSHDLMNYKIDAIDFDNPRQL